MSVPPGFETREAISGLISEMKVFLDTNVLVAASVRQHPHFRRADGILGDCARGLLEGVIHAHSILEFHSAITQLPGGLAVPSSQVQTILSEGILAHVRQTAMTPEEVLSVQKRAGEMGVRGGVIYDLYLLAVAEREEVDRLYTFNVRHFQKLASNSFAGRIVEP